MPSLDFFFQAEDGIRDYKVTGVQTCALPICGSAARIPQNFVDPGRHHFVAAAIGSRPDLLERGAAVGAEPRETVRCSSSVAERGRRAGGADAPAFCFALASSAEGDGSAESLAR